MNKYIIILIISSITISCDKKEDNKPCDVLVDNVYQFPELPSNHNWTSEQVYEYLNLPEDICKCIGTDGLIETCMNYPYLSLIWAGASPQSGYLLLKEKFRGFDELEEREDAGSNFLVKYKQISIDYDSGLSSEQIADYTFELYAFELIFSQTSILNNLNNDEKIELVETCLDKYNSKLDHPNNAYSSTIEGSTFILRNLMLMDNFKTQDDFYCLDCNYINLIIESTSDYLIYLKS
ncbi:MAG: hypothetical protein GX660_10085 [Clostridiaceae bacterium]|nr:hypothetical protein [Clostridiaceae bacterium]